MAHVRRVDRAGTERVSESQLVDAIRAAWSQATTADPDRWSAGKPAIGQCDVSSFVAWEYLGGDLVLWKVMVDGEQREHHYSNRIRGRDLDLSVEQFDGHEDIVEIAVLTHAEVAERVPAMRPELSERVATMRRPVEDCLDSMPGER